MLRSLRNWIRDAFDEQGRREEAWKAAEAKTHDHFLAVEERVRQRLATLCIHPPLRGKGRRVRRS